MKIIKWFKSMITMKRDGTSFYDDIGQVLVNGYVDCYGTRWLATSRLSSFRVKSNLN